jgi:phage terminase large subunit-like protein
LLTALLVGGNRSGKTEAGAQLAVAFALGRDHPAVVAWAAINGLDTSRIQLGPGTVCCSALTGNESRRIQRPKVTAYLPAGTDWSNQHGSGEATARLPGGGVIVFKSNDQGSRAFQGSAWHFLWMDEEHDEVVFNEGRMRLADHGGLACFSMTPLKGRTWVFHRFHDTTGERYEQGCASYALNSRDNPHVPQDYLDRLLATYGAHERAAREEGSFVTLEGRVYSFSRHGHVVPSFPIPISWPRFQGWDFGTRNPACVLWAALDPDDDVLHIYREHYRANWTTKQHAEHVLTVEVCPTCTGEPERSDGDEGVRRHPARWSRNIGEGYDFGRNRSASKWTCRDCTDHPGRTEPEPEWRVADPAAKGDRKTLSRHHEIKTIPADNAVRSGINDVAERLTPDAEGRPHLVFHDCCINTIAEIEGYVWNPTKSKADAPDMPLKRNDHAMDVTRYICRRVARRDGFGATA